MTETRNFKPSAGSSSNMLFVVSSNIDKVDADTRKQIRSHVRRGKKRKSTRVMRDRKTMKGGIRAAHKLEDFIAMCGPSFPARVGPELSFVEFPENIEPSLIVKWTQISNVAMTIIFPLLEKIGFRADPMDIFYPMGVDAAALHITAFAVDGFIDRVLRRQRYSNNPVAMLHLQRGLKLLQERLWSEDNDAKVSDSTMKAVLKLASIAHFDGDSFASKNHMQGLRKMVDLRGGLDVFKGNKLLTEMLRCDLSIAVLNYSTPVFFRQPSEAVPEYPEQLSADEINLQCETNLLPTLDDNLARAWWAMKRLCLLIDIGTRTKRLMNPNIICQTMTTVTYHLLHMSFVSGSVDEGIRLGLLAFCHHAFLQWKDIILPYYEFPSIYRDCILSLGSAASVRQELILWLWMIGANSLYDIHEEGWLRGLLREYIDRCQIKTWRGMQKVLESFLWIQELDELRDKQNFDLIREKRE